MKMEQEGTIVRTHDFHNGVKVSAMDIRSWHSQVFDKIKKGASHYSISCGNSMVRGYRASYENAIVILEFVNGYYQYTYPQPDEQIIELENEKQKEVYNQAIGDAIKVVNDEMFPGLVANELLNEIKRKLFTLIK